MTRGRFILFLIVFMSIGSFAAAWYATPRLFENKLDHFLSQQGMTSATITETHLSKNGIAFSNIHLDKDGFSTIDQLTTDFSFQNMIIDSLTLTGETSPLDLYLLTIAGWDGRTLPSVPNTNSLVLNNATFDLLTSAGSLRLQAKGRLIRQDDQSQKLEAALSGAQKQLSFNSSWNGLMTPDMSSWQIAGDIQDARFQFDHIVASRMSGWLNLRKNVDGIDSAGQFGIGLLRFGKKTALTNSTLTIKGPPDRYQMILNGDIAGYQNMRLLADLTQTQDGLQIDLSVSTENLGDLMRFIKSLHSDLQETPSKTAIFATLLLTPGNIDRIETELSRKTFDQLDFVISGVPYDLTGKIIAKRAKDGAEHSTVVSLAPVN